MQVLGESVRWHFTQKRLRSGSFSIQFAAIRFVVITGLPLLFISVVHSRHLGKTSCFSHGADFVQHSSRLQSNFHQCSIPTLKHPILDFKDYPNIRCDMFYAFCVTFSSSCPSSFTVSSYTFALSPLLLPWSSDAYFRIYFTRFTFALRYFTSVSYSHLVLHIFLILSPKSPPDPFFDRSKQHPIFRI